MLTVYPISKLEIGINLRPMGLRERPLLLNGSV